MANGVSASKPQANAILQLTPEGFLRRTQSKLVQVQTVKPYVDGGQVQFEIPRAGLGYQLWVQVSGTVTVAGTVSGGTIASYPNPMPYGFIKKLRFGSNNATYMRDHSGWSLYKHNRYRYGKDPLNTGSNVRYSAQSMAAMGLTNPGGQTRALDGTTITATTYAVNFMIPIPLSYNWAAETGLVVLQNQSVFTLSLDCATITGGIGATGGSNDFFTALAGTGLTVTSNIQIGCFLEFFEALDPSKFNYAEQLSMYMSVTDQTFPLVQGVNRFQPPQNDWYTLLLLEMIDNNAPLSPTQVSNIRLSHSGAVDIYLPDKATQMMRSYFMHDGLPPMDGVIDFDLGLRRGWLDRRDTIDAFNDMNITDLFLGATTSGLALVNSQATLTMEALRRVGS